MMKKTLVLTVDRDDDFGTKADVETPIIGVEGVMSAALKLGTVDPEDSDVNTVLTAIQIRNELYDEGKSVEVALICGDKKVGHVSDAAVVDELSDVLEKVNPDRVILVSDGSEDEFVYPIISSRIPIDSVRKVFVKQTPGLESSIYIVSRMLRDDDKKKRFLAPIGWVLIIFGLIFMLPKFLQFFMEGSMDAIYSMSGSLVIFALGLVLCIFAYNTMDKIGARFRSAINDVKSGNMSILFNVLAIAFLGCGIILGLLSVADMPESSFVYKMLTFFSNILWLTVFAVICNGVGTFIDNYMKTRTFNRTFLIGSISVLALAFMIQAIIDLFCSTLGYNYPGEGIIVYQFMMGIGFMMCAAILQMSFKEFFDMEIVEEEEVESDAL